MLLEILGATCIATVLAVSLAVVKLLLRVDRRIDYAIYEGINARAEILSHLLPSLELTGRIEPSLVASLTTTRDRLDLVHAAIQSMMMQTVRPRCINLYLSDRITQEEIPCSLARLRDIAASGLAIHFVPDVGPHTKLIYALQQFPDDLIVTFDDDLIYPSNTVDCLLRTHRRHPHAIVANWAREIPQDRRGRPGYIKKGRLLTPETLCINLNQKVHAAQPSHRAFAYGTGGVLYPPGALDPRVLDVDSLRRLCPTEDDIWFKAMAMLAGTPVVPTNLGIRPKLHNVRGSQATALRHLNHDASKNHNRQQMRAVFAEFDLGSRLQR
jgi:hypothetical protein